MWRFVSIALVVSFCAHSRADNLMVSYAAPLANYPVGGPPIVHPVYSYVSVSHFYDAAPYWFNAYNRGGFFPYYDNWFSPLGYNSWGYGGTFGYFPYAFVNPNIPNYTYSLGFNTGWFSPYVPGFDGTTPMSAFVAPAFLNSLESDRRSVQDSTLASAPSLPKGTAQIAFMVPADAEITIEGVRLQGSGTSRTVVTPPLSGPATYDVKIRRGGKGAEQSMSVTLSAGQRSSISVLQ